MRGLIPFALLFAAPALAQPASTHPTVLTVELSNFHFAPAVLMLKQGETYRIRFVNTASGGHDFVAKEFFASSQIAPADQSKLDDGAVDLGGHQTVVIELTPEQPGTYRSHCSHFMHSAFGMKGEVIVQPA